MATVTAPVAGYTGIVGRVRFLDGVGHTDDRHALRHFQLAGYTIEHDGPAATPDPDPADVTTADQPDDIGNGTHVAAQPDSTVHLATVPVTTTPATPERPRPSANKAEWFEYLDATKPGHGLKLENSTKADIIAALGDE